MLHQNHLIRLLLILVFFHLFVLVVGVSAQSNPEKDYCMRCHGKDGIMSFADGSSISIKVNRADLDRSVHKEFNCTDCHKEFSQEVHPKRVFRDKLQYQVKMSAICRNCHPNDAIKTKHIHNDLFRQEKEGKPIVCTDCHSAHRVSHTSLKEKSALSNQYCLSCHQGNNIKTQLKFSNGETKSLDIDINALNNSPHKDLLCIDCHVNCALKHSPKRNFKSLRHYRIANSEICKKCHNDKYWNFRESIHYKMISSGRLDAPTCVDCHDSHAMSSLKGNHLAITKSCKTCHQHVYEVYAKSVHGAALFDSNNKDVPVCTDCHTSHKIKKTGQSEFHNRIPEMCGNCHANKNLMAKYGLSTDVLKTYLSDFHGVTLSFYRKDSVMQYQPEPEIAVCTDCHGVHDIIKASGENALSFKKNLVHRCRSCHPEATESFPDAWMSHYQPGFKNAPLVFVIETIYKVLFPLCIIGIGFIMLLRLYRFIKDKQVENDYLLLESDVEITPQKYFNIYRITEHSILILCFFILVITGLPQKFYETPISQWLIVNMGGIVFVRQLHHVFGYIFTALLIQHIVVNFIAIQSTKWSPSMLISIKDYYDAVHDIKYYLGIYDSPSKHERYSYKEKFIYWLTLTGAFQMIITGLILRYPVFFSSYLPGQVIPASKSMHSNEAMLIFIIVVLWHMYDVFFRKNGPDWSIFTGYKKL